MDIDEIYIWVDRGRVGDARTPPGSAGKALFPEIAPLRILCRAQTARWNSPKFTYVKPEGNLNEVQGVRTPGGVAKGENSMLRLT